MHALSATETRSNTYRLIDETLRLLSIPRMSESFRDGKAESLEECAIKLDW